MTEREAATKRMSMYIALIFLAVTLSFYFFLMPLISKKGAFRQRVAELGREIEEERETHRKLRRERKLLEEGDPAFLEKYARDNFGWAREGEIIYKMERER